MLSQDARLKKQGWLGEGHATAQSVVFVKSHEPLLSFKMKEKYTKALYVVRNPLDSIWSFFSFLRTRDHSKTLNATVIIQNKDKLHRWDQFVKENTDHWNNHVLHWRARSRSTNTSVLFIK